MSQQQQTLDDHYTSEEISELVRLYGEHYLAFNKNARANSPLNEKHWEKLTNEYNAKYKDSPRTQEELSDKWNDLKNDYLNVADVIYYAQRGVGRLEGVHKQIDEFFWNDPETQAPVTFCSVRGLRYPMRMIDPDQIDRAEVVEIKGDEKQREPPSTNNSNTQEPKRKTSVSQSSSENPKLESEEKSQSWQSFEDASNRLKDKLQEIFSAPVVGEDSPDAGNRLKDKLQEFFSAPVVGEDSPVRQERRKNMMDLLQKMLDDRRQKIIKDTE